MHHQPTQPPQPLPHSPVSWAVHGFEREGLGASSEREHVGAVVLPVPRELPELRAEYVGGHHLTEAPRPVLALRGRGQGCQPSPTAPVPGEGCGCCRAWEGRGAAAMGAAGMGHGRDLGCNRVWVRWGWGAVRGTTGLECKRGWSTHTGSRCNRVWVQWGAQQKWVHSRCKRVWVRWGWGAVGCTGRVWVQLGMGCSCSEAGVQVQEGLGAAGCAVGTGCGCKGSRAQQDGVAVRCTGCNGARVQQGACMWGHGAGQTPISPLPPAEVMVTPPGGWGRGCGGHTLIKSTRVL